MEEQTDIEAELSLGAFNEPRRAGHAKQPARQVLTTPTKLLRVTLCELSSRAGWALWSGEAALVAAAVIDTQSFWDRIDLMLVHGSTASNFIWPNPRRKARLAKGFPRRGEDLQTLLGIGHDTFRSLLSIRDALVHIDERFEEQMLDNPDQSVGSRSMTGRVLDCANFFVWDPTTATLIHMNDQIAASASGGSAADSEPVNRCLLRSGGGRVGDLVRRIQIDWGSCNRHTKRAAAAAMVGQGSAGRRTSSTVGKWLGLITPHTRLRAMLRRRFAQRSPSAICRVWTTCLQAFTVDE